MMDEMCGYISNSPETESRLDESDEYLKCDVLCVVWTF